MARGRMIDKRIGKSKKLAKLKSDKARVVYFMVYPHTDCEGRFAADDLEDLKDECISKLPGYTLQRIAESLNDLAEVGLIILYEWESKICIEFTKFDNFQTIRKDREAPSSIPSPEDSGGLQEHYRLTPLLSLSLRKFKEGKKEIIFDFEKRAFLYLLDEDKKTWKEAYPKCDIELELKQMAAWLLADPKRKKKNYKRFINGWLSRTQDRGGTDKFKNKQEDESPEMKAYNRAERNRKMREENQ